MLSACGFESHQAHHVGAKSAPLIIPTQKGGDFSYRSLAPPFRPRFASLDSRTGLNAASKVSTPPSSRSFCCSSISFRKRSAGLRDEVKNGFESERPSQIAASGMPLAAIFRFVRNVWNRHQRCLHDQRNDWQIIISKSFQSESSVPTFHICADFGATA